MKMHHLSLVTAILFLALPAHFALAQIANDNPACRRDPIRGIVCSGNPPVTVTRENAIKFAIASEMGGFDGFRAGVHYDHELRGADHLLYGEFSMGTLSFAGEHRLVSHAEVMGTFLIGKAYRPMLGFRHEMNAEIGHPFTLITGARLGRTQHHVTMRLESGVITNRNSGDTGVESTLALTGYRNLSFFEVDASLRAGMGWNAGGALTGVNVGITRRIGSQIKVRGEWNREQLSGKGENAAVGGNQFRVTLSAALWGMK